MQDGAQKSSAAEGRLLGFVRVLVGGQTFHLPVQAVSFDKDGDRTAGGFFVHGSQLGILVDGGAPKSLVEAQIAEATADAVRHLSRKILD